MCLSASGLADLRSSIILGVSISINYPRDSRLFNLYGLESNLKKVLLYVASFCLICSLASTAHAQQFDLSFGMSGLVAPATSSTTGLQTIGGGSYTTLGLDFLFYCRQTKAVHQIAKEFQRLETKKGPPCFERQAQIFEEGKDFIEVLEVLVVGF